MNRLKGSIVYLAGPMDSSDDYGVGWRNNITPFLTNLGIDVLDPTNKPTQENEYVEDNNSHVLRRELKNNRKFQELHDLGKPIRHFDLRCVDMASVLIAYLDYSIPMCGTWDEIFKADSERKPVLIFCKQGLTKVSDWLYWTFPPEFFFDTLELMKEYLLKIDSGTIKPHKRWILFDK